MMKVGYRALIAALLMLLSGCVYSHTVVPLTVNQDPTEVKESLKEGRGRVNQFQYPLTFGLSVRLGKNGLGEIAKKHGMDTIYYADLERFYVLFGLWSMETVHVYGR